MNEKLNNPFDFYTDTNYAANKEYVRCFNAMVKAYSNQKRVRIYYGDQDTGVVWPEEHNTMGYIAKSTGKLHAFILVYNHWSLGGDAIAPRTVVGIQDVKTKQFLYKNEKFYNPRYYVEPNECIVRVNNKKHAQCETYTEAVNLASFLNGDRMKLN